MGFWDLIKSLFLMLLIIIAAYYATKLIARAQTPGKNGGRIRLLSVLRLGKDSSVVMVEIERTVYILGVGSQRVELLDKLPADQLAASGVGDEGGVRPDFASILKKELGEKLRRLK